MEFTLKDIERLIKEALKEEPTNDRFLDNRYNDQIAIVNHTQPYYRLFRLIAQEFKPGLVVELGGWQGTAAAHFAAGAPEAQVFTVDHHSDPGDDHNKAKMLEVTNTYQNVTYFQGWTSPGFVEEYHKGRDAYEDIKRAIGSNKIDILFIDSWHEGRYLKRDWDHYKDFLANEALVIVDDVFDSELFVDIISTFEDIPGERIVNAQVHPGVPMGFIRQVIEPAPKPKRATRKRTTRKAK